MPVRNEWTEWHLTPRGWERGSTRVLGKGNTWADEPADRVRSFVYREIEGDSEVSRSAKETWRPRPEVGQFPPEVDGVEIGAEPLLNRYGSCPERL